MTPAQRVTRGFSIGEEQEEERPRRVRTRQEIKAGQGKRPPASVELALLAHNPYNPREELTDVEETAESLAARGQLQPVAVVSLPAFLAVHPQTAEKFGPQVQYVVIDGNRRLAAAPLAGVAGLEIYVNDALASSAHDLLESALIANIHRVDVPPIDQAKAIQELLKVHGTQDAVAGRLQKSSAWVSQRLALLGLPDDLREKVDSKELSVEDGRRIGRIRDEDDQRAEAAAALARVKPPRKPREAARVVPQKNASVSEGVNGVNSTPAPAAETTSAPEVVNGVNSAGPSEGIADAVQELVRLTAGPDALADALAEHLPADVLHAVAERLLSRVE
uniref:ParB/RepB/Spo0J family partition protein n=1 Tax=Kitasatospora indigofera TaxID=67307 RepID=UPI002F90E2EA